MRIRVYYEDTDAGGVVYHANYLRFCERARSEAFFSKGTSPQRGERHFVITHMEAYFKAPARLGDLIEIQSSVSHMGHASLVIDQTITLEGKTLFSMKGTFALTNAQGQPCRLTAEEKALFT